MILYSVCMRIYIACLFFVMFTRKGSRRVLKHEAGGWKTQFHLHAITPSIQILVLSPQSTSKTIGQAAFSRSPCAKSLGSNRARFQQWLPGEDYLGSTGRCRALCRTPPVPSKWQPKNFAHLRRVCHLWHHAWGIWIATTTHRKPNHFGI